MALEVFGFTFGKENKPTKSEKGISSPVPPEGGDSTPSVSTSYGYVENAFATTSGTNTDLKEKIDNRWSLYDNAEIKFVVDEIINEMIDFSVKAPIKIEFEERADEKALPKKLKEAITESTYNTFGVLNRDLSNTLIEWYVQGVKTFFIQLSEDKKSIVDLKPIDPTLLTYKKPTAKITNKDGVDTFEEQEPYWQYKQNNSKVIKLHKDSILWVDSGLGTKTNVKSYLDFAEKPMNDLLTLENSSVIYRLTRAPEKRAFYVDTGSLPPTKSEEYVKSLMNRFKSKVDYDSKTGKIQTSNRNVIGATVDYWFPRREGSNATEIDIISESSNAVSNIIDEINYFKNKLYSALFIPKSRVEQDPGFHLGQPNSISREEVKFSQLIAKLEHQFMKGVYHLIKLDLILKGYIKENEWDDINQYININFINNDFFAESKRLEMIQSRLNMMRDITEYQGKFFSKEYINKNILGFTDEEIEAMQKQIESEPEPEDTGW